MAPSHEAREKRPCCSRRSPSGRDVAGVRDVGDVIAGVGERFVAVVVPVSARTARFELRGDLAVVFGVGSGRECWLRRWGRGRVSWCDFGVGLGLPMAWV